MRKRAKRAVLFFAPALAFHPGCSGHTHPPVTVSVGHGSDSGAHSGALAPAQAPRSPRPDGGPILPPADEEIPLPFGAPTVRVHLELPAVPNVLDVQLSIDTTGSISDEIDELQTTLENTVVPGLHARVADVSFGVAKFADFPGRPFGWPGDTMSAPDQPFVLLTPITSDLSAVASSVARLDQPLADGGDVPEAGFEALYQIATGKGYQLNGQTLIVAYDHKPRVGGGTAGGVGFRNGALRVVLHVTDAPSHEPSDYGNVFPGTHGLSDAGAALRAIDARLVAIVSGACGGTNTSSCHPDEHAAARAQLEQLALMTGALGPSPVNGTCPHGVNGAPIASNGMECPLVFDVDTTGRGLPNTAVQAVAGLVDGIRFDAVTGSVIDDPIGFVKGVVPAPSSGVSDGGAPATADLLPEGNPDGVLDSFIQVHAGEAIAFDVELKNDRIRSSDVDQVFRVQIEIKGDQLVLLERTLRVRVPKGDSLAPDDAGR